MITDRTLVSAWPWLLPAQQPKL